MGADESGILVAEYTSLRYCVGVQITYERVESWSARWRMLLSYSAFRTVGPGRCCRRSLSALTMLVGIVLPLAAHAGGDDWADLATVSMTNPTTPKLTANRLCYTDGRDIACDGAAGLLVTSGTLAIPNISATALTVNGVPITGNASGDRITSGTAGVFANMIGGYVSLTTGATTWGYLGSSATYLPTLAVGGNISATSISTTVAQIASRTVGSIAGGGGNYIVSGTTSVSASSAGSITFLTGGVQRMGIDSSGRVGIGTASPGYLFDVSGTQSGSGANIGTARITTDSPFNCIILNNSSAAGHSWSTCSAGTSSGVDGSYYIYDSSAAAMRLLIGSSGNVGIGTPSPASKLNIEGTSGSLLRVTNGGAMKFDIDSNGTGWMAGVLTQSSDRRLKMEIHQIPSPLKKLEGVNGVTFRWRDRSRGQSEQMGLIAQEVQRSFPQLVSADASGTLSVNYSGMIAPLLEAVKELATRERQLRASNDNLRAELTAANKVLAVDSAAIEALRRRVEALESAR